VLAKLKELDHVAYVRFASVYKQFADIESFFQELRGLKQEQKIKGRKAQSIDLLSTFVNESATKN
jgi:transcriptional repressor NrdR